MTLFNCKPFQINTEQFLPTIYAERGLLRITKKDSDPGGMIRELQGADAVQAAYLQWKMRKMRMNRMAFREHRSYLY